MIVIIFWAVHLNMLQVSLRVPMRVRPHAFTEVPCAYMCCELGHCLAPAAQEIESAWSEWEEGKNGSKATRVAQMIGALVSGSDFEGASMSGVNMLLVNGRYANLQKTLQHAANFR